MQKQGGEEGFESVAHGEAGEQISSSGEALQVTSGRWRSATAGDEDGDGNGSTGRSGLRGSAEGFRARRRSSWACRRGEGVAVATATVAGGDGSARP